MLWGPNLVKPFFLKHDYRHQGVLGGRGFCSPFKSRKSKTLEGQVHAHVCAPVLPRSRFEGDAERVVGGVELLEQTPQRKPPPLLRSGPPPVRLTGKKKTLLKNPPPLLQDPPALLKNPSDLKGSVLRFCCDLKKASNHKSRDLSCGLKRF